MPVFHRLPCTLLAVLVAVSAGGAAEIPPTGESILLFDGSSMENFETFVFGQGFNQDPDGVFRLQDGMIRVEGIPYGYFITREAYSDFYLRVLFRWGEATHGRRKDMARDSGILYRAVEVEERAARATSNGTIWPKCLEFQIMEGGTGDVILLGGSEMTVRGRRWGGERGIQIDRFGKTDLGRRDGWPVHYRAPAGFRDPDNEVERPHGEWNELEMVADGDRVRYWVNGTLVMEGSEASLDSGRILFQSEGSELYYGTIELRPLLRKRGQAPTTPGNGE